ncbi:MAG: hypothetical protein QOD35_2036 [Nocardioidaceae bacterium]|nr:hypothetical protein [Nocardioidaceae bacterium]
MFKKTLIMTAPVLASAALVAGGLSASTLQADAAGSHHDSKAPFGRAMKTGNEVSCVGGAQKATYNGGVHDTVSASSNNGPTIVPGTLFRVNGPRHGRDVLSVSFTAQDYLDSNSSQGKVKVLLDGIPMAPSDLNNGSPIYAQGYGTFAQNYCRNIGPGHHSLRVTISDVASGTSAGALYLWDPMLHAEKSE